MARGLIVSVNGVTQGTGDFFTKGHTITLTRTPNVTDVIAIKSITKDGVNGVNYYGTGTQTTFNLPAYPRSNFEVIADSKESVPEGYTVVDLNHEIMRWVKDECPISDWKWADLTNEEDELVPIGMVRMIIKDSTLTYIATKWA